MTARDRQLLFDLAAGEGRGAEDFVVGPANARAHGFIAAWPDWPHHLAVLTGPPGSGKSHLAGLWAARSGAVEAAAGSPDLAAILAGGHRAVLVEDADRPGRDETGLFHLANLVAERGGHMLVTACAPPGAWPVGLADLASRLRSATPVEIAAPGEDLLEAIMVKLFADRQIAVAPEVVAYALARMERSPAAARRLVAALDRLSLERHSGVGTRLVADALDEIAAPDAGPDQ
jgi:chromosomal replication initiation ATPase DnaA